MTCIKTGARVFLENYACVVAADLYRVADAVVIRMNEKALENANRMPDAPRTHDAYIPEGGGENYWNKQIGILVVPAQCVVEVA